LTARQTWCWPRLSPSVTGRTSVIMYLCKGKNAAQQQLGERSENMCEKQRRSKKINEEAGQEGSPGARAEIPLQPVMKTMVR